MIKRFIYSYFISKKLFKSLMLFATLFFVLLFLFTNSSKSALNLPLCNSSSVASPNPAITGGNCILPSCNALLNELSTKRRPAIDCLADCNAMPSGITAIDGQNCLYDCNNLPASITITQPGKNCAYKINDNLLPFCNPVASPKGYGLSDRYILPSGTDKSPRFNCADLIDLTLCSAFTSGSKPGKNCVETCPSLGGATVDNRVHNRDCIRFCGEEELGAPSPSQCILKSCQHLLGSGINPNSGSNCNLLKCTALTEVELTKQPLYLQSMIGKEYCNKSDKCLLFNQTQLNAILTGYNAISDPKTGPLYRMCQLQDCRVENDGTCAPYSSDDVAKISTPSDYNNAYINTVIKTISSSYSGLTDLCKLKICRGVVKTQLACSGTTTKTLNPECDSGSSCDSDGYCPKTADCDNLQLSPAIRSAFCDGNPQPQSQFSSDLTNSYPYLVEKTWFYLPKPMDKAYKNNNPNDGFRVMQKPDICYSVDDMLDSSNNFGKLVNEVGGIGVLMGWFTGGRTFRPYFHDYASYDTRSPTYCYPAFKHGNRGMGYSYLCGARDFTSKPDMENVGYVDSISSTWSNNGTASHKLRVCLRYNNMMLPRRTCGARECGITCAFEDCSTVCGFDECRDLIINDSTIRKCENPSEASDECVSQIGSGADLDSYIRVRAVGFPSDNRVCAILDWKGGLAYNGMFMDGSETLAEDSTKCLSGSYDATSKKCTGGKNSNDDKGSASVWRALGLIKYVTGNIQLNGLKGIKDVNNNFSPEANCIKRQLRAPPPNFYNLATYENSPGLFSPPLIIKTVKTKIGGENSVNENPTKYLFGATDFNQPQVEVLFGNATALVSLDIGKTGNEQSAEIDTNSVKNIVTKIFDKTFAANIYAKKNTDPFGNPQFCIYRKLLDKSNNEITPPPTIGCVRRNLPTIDKCDPRDGLCVSPTNAGGQNYRDKFAIERVADNSDNNYKQIDVMVKFFVNINNQNINNLNCPASNAGSNIICSKDLITKFNLTDRAQMSYCYSPVNGLEGYPLCLTRDDCSYLNMECMENQVKLSSGISSDSLLGQKEACIQKLLTCNKKKNIVSRDFDPSIFNANPNDNYYGWFNEVCITSGFNHKLRTVYAYKIDSQNGKCIVDPRLSIGNCDAGGKMPNCPCTEYSSESVPAHIQTISAINRIERLETPHEAGLCVDIPTPKTCSSINYLLVPDDRYYLTGSLDKLVSSGYNDLTGVHTSHQYRTQGKTTSPAILLRGHAEFNATIIGTTSVGYCNGFWKHKFRSGIKAYPELSCIKNGDVGQWNSSLSNPLDECERYKCPALISTGVAANGEYENNYASSENDEAKGTIDGNAYWNEIVNTTDFASSTTAIGCIVGFKEVSSDSIISSPPSAFSWLTTAQINSNASLLKLITGHTTGTKPSRICNQIGEWKTPTNSCQRITCPEINPGAIAPSTANDKKLWQKTWELSGGAKFPISNASRSSNPDIEMPLSKITGTCESQLGYKISGSSAPTLYCDHLGNWTKLTNPCRNSCNTITRTSIPDSSGESSTVTSYADGFATWDKGDVPIDYEYIEKDGTCNNAEYYYNYPYPARRKTNGEKYLLNSLLTTLSEDGNSIPEDVKVDTRPTNQPVRTCKKSIYYGTTSSQWTTPSSTCVTTEIGSGLPNGCVGGSSTSDDLMEDDRINAGITKHTIRNGSEDSFDVRIPWDRRKFGEYQIKYCDSGNNYCQNRDQSSDGSHNSSTYYSASKNLGRFTLVRYCDTSTKKWGDPYPVCVAIGSLGNSLNASVSTSHAKLFKGEASTHYLVGLDSNIFGLNSKVNMTCDSTYAANETPIIQCKSENTSYADSYQLTKIDSNVCTKTCTTNTSGAPSSGTSYAGILKSSSINQTFYDGQTLQFQCADSAACGTPASATCVSNGWQLNSTPTCHACLGCGKSSTNNLPSQSENADLVTTILTRTLSNGSVTERFSVACLLRVTQASNKIKRFYGGTDESKEDIGSFPNFTHGNEIFVAQVKSSGGDKLCMASGFRCNDGRWDYFMDHSNRGDCNYLGNEYDPYEDWCGKGQYWVTRTGAQRGYPRVPCYDYYNTGDKYLKDLAECDK